MHRRAFLTTVIGGGVAATMLPGVAEAASWLHLGTRRVNGLADVDRIHVGGNWGRFRRVRLRVRGNDLFLYRMVLEFGNGGRQEVGVRAFIPQGGYTRAIDLSGDKRFIRHVTFFYGKLPNGHGPTFVELYGRR
ncbi:MAG: hypothetical protein AB7S80_16870 [Rhizobiaceae bacterium]